jgi:NAD(P)-dependent dehydrogenase (short-subunit alcohol dehydrogenase family)
LLATPIESESISSWAKVLAVKLSGVFYCLQQEIQSFLQLGGGGSIVNVSSDAGSVASNYRLRCLRCLENGVNGLTKTTALDYARNGVRVNAQPTGRCGRPKEITELICFLPSDRAAFMTGSIVAIDGGTTKSGF